MALPSFDEMSTTPHEQSKPAQLPSFDQMSETPDKGELPSFDQMSQEPEEQPGKYDDNHSLIKTFGEGVSQGVAGPLAAYAEKKLTNEKPEDILGRAEAHPWIHGAGEAAGFAGSMLTGIGEGRLIVGAGEMATHAMQAASIGQKIAKGAAAAAVEMGMFQASDEATKAVLDAPNTVGTIASNIGLSATLGGLTGGVIHGTGGALKKVVSSSVLKDFVDTLAYAKSNSSPAELMHREVDNVYRALGNVRSSIDTLPPEVQKSVAKSVEKISPLMEDFESKFTDVAPEGHKVISPDKFDTYVNSSDSLERKKMMGDFVDGASKHFDEIGQAFDKAGQPNPFDSVGMSALKNSLDKPSIGTKMAQAWMHKLSADTLGSAMGIGVGEYILPGFGGAYIGKELLGPAFTAMIKPMLEQWPRVDIAAFEKAYATAQQLNKGNKVVSDAVKSVVGSGRVIPSKLMPKDEDLDKLDDQVKNLNSDPNKMGVNLAYLPEHSMMASKQLMAQSMYLNQKRPNPQAPSPMDTVPQVTKAQEGAYKRTLTIAQQPLSILQEIKDGTISMSHIQDMKALHPEFADMISKKMLSEVAKAKNAGIEIPYVTRMGISAMVGSALDSTLTPQAIMAAQPKPQQSPQQQAPKGKSKGSPSKMSNKSSNLAKTADQEAETDRSDRD
jgi:hypothetical protein